MLDGGPTLNPSTYDLLAAIHAVPAEEVVVLPNSANVIMAAERAAELSEKAVSRRRLALAAGRPGRRRQPRSGPPRASDNAEAMNETLERVRTGAVAPAARDDAQGRFRPARPSASCEDELVAWGEPPQTLRDVLARLGEDAELITCLRGDDAPLDDAAVEALVSARRRARAVRRRPAQLLVAALGRVTRGSATAAASPS